MGIHVNPGAVLNGQFSATQGLFASQFLADVVGSAVEPV